MIHTIKLSILCACLAGFHCLTSSCKGKSSPSTQAAESGDKFGAARPKIVVERPEHHFGNVTVGDSLVHSFVVRNSGTQKLVINGVVETCNCTEATPKDREIAAGASTTVELRYRPNGITGPDRQSVTLRTNDPENPELPLIIEANVAPDIMFEPDTLHLIVDDPIRRKQVARLTGRVFGGRIPMPGPAWRWS